MDLINFKRKILKIDGPRIHKVRNSLGVYDAYKYYRKVKPKGKDYILTESQYFAIVRHVNNILSKKITKGETVELPHRMGALEVRKYDKTIRIGDDGKVYTNLPIDWDSTLKLWYEDSEAMTNKTLVRVDENELYKLIYNKRNAEYINQSFYEFSFNRELKKQLKQNIKDGVTDALAFK